jgi:hypothetical protein
MGNLLMTILAHRKALIKIIKVALVGFLAAFSVHTCNVNKQLSKDIEAA